MDPLSLSTVASMSDTALVAGDPERMVLSVVHDTRRIKPGSLYVAFQGERVDGNDFLLEAASKGAVGAICHGNIPSGIDANFGILKTEDTLQALASLAAAWRTRLSLRSIMLTGSNGKTTTKDFTAAVLRTSFRTSSTEGNFNSNIGLPLSILNASTFDEVAVWEVGMNHRGEIAPLASLGRPDIAIITNIGTAHIGFLGSQDAIAEEKGDLLAALDKSGVAILPAADFFFPQLVKRTSARIVSVGIECGDLYAENITTTSEGSHFQICYQGKVYPAFLPLVGRHMISNALLALAAGVEAGVSLEKSIQALRHVKASKGRFHSYQHRGIMLVDASYNANADSMEADLAALHDVGVKERRIGILGRMAELGNYEQEAYQRVGKAAAQVVDILIAVGKETAELSSTARHHGLQEVHEVDDNAEASSLLLSLAREGDLLFFKGSLSANLKEVVSNFCKKLDQ